MPCTSQTGCFEPEETSSNYCLVDEEDAPVKTNAVLSAEMKAHVCCVPCTRRKEDIHFAAGSRGGGRWGLRPQVGDTTKEETDEINPDFFFF